MSETRRLDDDEGIIYFAQCAEDGPIKIGYTTRGRLPQRLGALQTGLPFPLILRRVVPGGRSKERKLHDFFAKHRMMGEWFWADPEVAYAANGRATPASIPHPRAVIDG